MRGPGSCADVWPIALPRFSCQKVGLFLEGEDIFLMMSQLSQLFHLRTMWGGGISLPSHFQSQLMVSRRRLWSSGGPSTLGYWGGSTLGVRFHRANINPQRGLHYGFHGMPGRLALLLHDHFPTHPALCFHQPNFKLFAFHSCHGGATLRLLCAKFRDPVVWFTSNTAVGYILNIGLVHLKLG